MLACRHKTVIAAHMPAHSFMPAYSRVYGTREMSDDFIEISLSKFGYLVRPSVQEYTVTTGAGRPVLHKAIAIMQLAPGPHDTVFIENKVNH